MLFSVFIFTIFNIVAGVYNTSTLRTTLPHLPPQNKILHTWGQFLNCIVNANQIIFGASILMYILTYFGLLPAFFDNVTSYCFILCGTLNLFAAFYLTSFYLSVAPVQTKKRVLIVSGATLFSSLYAVYNIFFISALSASLRKNDIYPFFNLIQDDMASSMILFAFGVMTSVYFLQILLHLHRNTKNPARFLVRCALLGACLNFFIYCYLAAEMVLAFLPDNAVSSAFFHAHDRTEALHWLVLLFALPAINIFFISVLTPFYAYSKHTRHMAL